MAGRFFRSNSQSHCSYLIGYIAGFSREVEGMHGRGPGRKEAIISWGRGCSCSADCKRGCPGSWYGLLQPGKTLRVYKYYQVILLPKALNGTDRRECILLIDGTCLVLHGLVFEYLPGTKRPGSHGSCVYWYPLFLLGLCWYPRVLRGNAGTYGACGRVLVGEASPGCHCPLQVWVRHRFGSAGTKGGHR